MSAGRAEETATQERQGEADGSHSKVRWEKEEWNFKGSWKG